VSRVTVNGSADPAIRVEGVSKRYRIPHEHVNTLKERALHPFRRSSSEDLQALQDVSFEVRRGEFFGIVGRNGSGKSTLLMCLAGIYAIDDGGIAVSGRMATFIELGVGFNPDLPATDNIVLNAIILGLSRREARERVERVLEFAELQEFRELKLKNYSSGMHVRLAFSVMIQVDAEVLLIDEVLAVGDAAFQQKCYDEFNRLRDAGRTILFVTHDMGAVTRFCHRAMLLERGRVVMIGDPEEVARRYIRVNFPELAPSGSDVEFATLGQRAAYIMDTWFEDEAGEPREYLPQGSLSTLRARIRFDHPLDDPSFALLLKDARARPVFATSTIWNDEHTGSFRPGEEIVFGVRFENLLAPGRYYATVQIAERGSGSALIDERDRAATMVSTGARETEGVVLLPHDLVVERGQDSRRRSVSS
jgi:ABC-type polysaccharide/polyol phosphate transport system ATPase subunit